MGFVERLQEITNSSNICFLQPLEISIPPEKTSGYLASLVNRVYDLFFYCFDKYDISPEELMRNPKKIDQFIGVTAGLVSLYMVYRGIKEIVYINRDGSACRICKSICYIVAGGISCMASFAAFNLPEKAV